MGTYRSFNHTRQLLQEGNKDGIELWDAPSAILISRDLAGKVMATTTQGLDGRNPLYVNPGAVKKPDLKKPFHAEGGHRWWLMPEGQGEMSFYLPEGTTDFSPENLDKVWGVDPSFDKAAMSVIGEREPGKIHLRAFMNMVNARGNVFKTQTGVRYELKKRLEDLREEVGYVGYTQKTSFVNRGQQTWGKDYGMIAPWSLNMLEAGPKTWIILPVNRGCIEQVVDYNMSGEKRDEPMPSEKFLQRDDYGLLRADGKCNWKRGLKPGTATGYIASIDLKEGLLTIMTVPVIRTGDYLDNRWKPEDLFGGTCIDCYNDGGGLGEGDESFYELEGVCRAKVVKPGNFTSMKVEVDQFQVDPSRMGLLFGVLGQVTGVDVSGDSVL
jgi:hypothetical protein